METCRPVRQARLRCQESLKDFWWGDVWHQKGRQADLWGSETLVSKEPSSPPGDHKAIEQMKHTLSHSLGSLRPAWWPC